MIDLSGQVVLITAAAQGIGRASAEAFHAAGATVRATDINEAGLERLPCATHRLDVLDGAAVEALVSEIGRVDVLFNCAGIVHGGAILEAQMEDLDFAFDLNVKAMVRTIKAVLPAMIERQRGCIISMSSVASAIKGVPNRFAYSATKAAVLGLTKSVAADYVTCGIRCNAICPGTVQSPSLDQRRSAVGRRCLPSPESERRRASCAGRGGWIWRSPRRGPRPGRRGSQAAVVGPASAAASCRRPPCRHYRARGSAPRPGGGRPGAPATRRRTRAART